MQCRFNFSKFIEFNGLKGAFMEPIGYYRNYIKISHDV